MLHKFRLFQCTEYDASAAHALVDGPVDKIVHVHQVQVVRSQSRSRSCILFRKSSMLQTLQCTECDASAAHALVDGPVVKIDTVPSRHVSFAETVEKVEFDPAVAYRAPKTMMTLPATTPLVHAADMTSPATIPLVHAADMEESGLYSDDIKLVMLHGNCSRSEAVFALRANDNDLIEAILCLEKEETVMQAVNSDIIERTEKRTLRISPVADTPESQTLQ